VQFDTRTEQKEGDFLSATDEEPPPHPPGLWRIREKLVNDLNLLELVGDRRLIAQFALGVLIRVTLVCVTFFIQLEGKKLDIDSVGFSCGATVDCSNWIHRKDLTFCLQGLLDYLSLTTKKLLLPLLGISNQAIPPLQSRLSLSSITHHHRAQKVTSCGLFLVVVYANNYCYTRFCSANTFCTFEWEGKKEVCDPIVDALTIDTLVR